MQPETSLGVSCERQQLPFSFLPQLGDRWRGVTVLLLFTQGIQFSEDALRDHGRQHRPPPLLCSSALIEVVLLFSLRAATHVLHQVAQFGAASHSELRWQIFRLQCSSLYVVL